MQQNQLFSQKAEQKEETEAPSEASQKADVPAGQQVSDAAQAPATTSVSRRSLWIRPEVKPQKASKNVSGKHLKPGIRLAILLLAILFISGATLTTLVPLATGQSGFNIPSALGSLIHSAQTEFQSLVQQNNVTPTAEVHLVPMNIPHNELVALAQQDATAAGISPTYFVRQINLESGFNPNAISPGGAEGIAQFEPSTAAGLGIDPFNPTEALQAAAQMMGRSYRQYGDYAKALAAYNAGSGSLQNAENACGANWLSCLSAQTQNYVAVIMGT